MKIKQKIIVWKQEEMGTHRILPTLYDLKDINGRTKLSLSEVQLPLLDILRPRRRDRR